MTKEQFLKSWSGRSDLFKSDLDAVIATEIAKVKVQPQPEELKGNCSTFDMSRLVDQPQPTINPIEQAYERGEKIRAKFWKKGTWAIKNSDTHAVDEKKVLWDVQMWDFKTKPEKWELYTEPTDQVTDHEQPETNVLNEQFSEVHHKIVDGLGTILSSFGANSGIMSIVMSWGDTQDSVSTLQMLNGYIEKYIDKQPVEPKQPSSQVILDNSFDRERFEAMFRAVVASNRSDNEFIETENILKELDAYYASKEGGNTL